MIFLKLACKLIIIVAGCAANAQTIITGKVIDEDSKPVANAEVLFKNETPVYTDHNGKFTISFTSGSDSLMIRVSKAEFKTRKIYVSGNFKGDDLTIVLEKDYFETEDIVVTGDRKGVYLKDSPVKIEVLTNEELNKVFATDFTKALEYIPGVKPQNNCGVCGTSDIRIQGLEGQYTQILVDGHPVMSNLGTVYGFKGINTANIKQVEIVKGPGTILFGPEAVAGTINIILKDPSEMSSYSFEAATTNTFENKFIFSKSIKSRNIEGAFTFDYNNLTQRFDENGDGFMDEPQYSRFAFFPQVNIYPQNDFQISLQGKYYYEDRFGGQMTYNKENHRGGAEVYGESIYTNREEFFGKISKIISDKISFESNISQIYHNQNSYYGLIPYMAEQFTIYADGLAFLNHNLRSNTVLGMSYKHETYDDNTTATMNPEDPAINQAAYYNIYSVFVQNEYKFSPRLTTLLGLRYNFHNIQKSILQPRASLKFQIGNSTTLRASFGTGFRTVNIFTEDHAALTGSRQVIIDGSLNPEKSINGSFNLVKDFDFENQFAQLTFDAHYTRFSNQIIPDYNSDPDLIVYRNLEGYSLSQGIEASFEFQFRFPAKLKLSYEYLDVYKNENGIHQELLFVPDYTLNFDITFFENNTETSVNLVGKLVGQQRLPEIIYPEPRPLYSKPFSELSLQLSREFQSSEIYLGVTNIFNYKQDTPLIDPQNPFGVYFDTTYIYGPLHGREFFAGIRLNLN